MLHCTCDWVNVNILHCLLTFRKCFFIFVSVGRPLTLLRYKNIFAITQYLKKEETFRLIHIIILTLGLTKISHCVIKCLIQHDKRFLKVSSASKQWVQHKIIIIFLVYFNIEYLVELTQPPYVLYIYINSFCLHYIGYLILNLWCFVLYKNILNTSIIILPILLVYTKMWK